jgi:hypothetical protein
VLADTYSQHSRKNRRNHRTPNAKEEFLLANSPAGAAGAAGSENIFVGASFASEAGKKKHQKLFSWKASPSKPPNWE